MLLFEVFLSTGEHAKRWLTLMESHGRDAFSSRFEIVEHFATPVDRLTVQKLLNEPKDQSWFAKL